MKYKIIKSGSLFIYYLFAKYIGFYYIPFLRNLGRRLRFEICKQIFTKMGDCVNIESNVYFGRGEGLIIGDRSSLGRNFWMQGTFLEVGDDVMIGQDVMILGGGHKFSDFLSL